MNIDADVIIPNGSEIPVIAFEYREFSQDDINNIVNLLCKGKRLYEPCSELTVDDIDEEIINLKKILSEARKDKGEPSANGATLFSPDAINEIIKGYEELRKTAPTEIKRVPASFILPSEKEAYGFTGETDAPINERETISIICSPGTGTQVAYYNPSFLTHSYKAFTDTVPDGLSISEQDAIEQARQLLHDLGESQMQLSSIVADKASLEPEFTSGETAYLPYYQLTFMRSINNIPSTYDFRYFTNDDNAEAVYYERIYIFINDEGVAAFEWNSPLVQKETLNENVGLLGFDEIIKEALKGLPLAASKDITGYKDKTIVNINNIRLGYMQVKQKNSANKFMFIPVWDFFGTSESHFTYSIPGWSIDENGWLKQNNLAKSFITINAIDGSVIDRNLGY
ncbi:MAG: DUF6034 family protein [Burkholderiales bacterium]